MLNLRFKPLQMEWRNLRTLGTVAALVVTFLFSGIWHGASWNFLVWGLLHGIYYLGSVVTKSFRERCVFFVGIQKMPLLHKLIRQWITFHLVCVGWIFFRANSVGDGWYILTHLFAGWQWKLAGFGMGLGVIETGLSLALIGFLLWVHGVQEKISLRHWIFSQPVVVRWSSYLGIVLATYIFGYYQSQTQFIYFQF